ncbi:response regulator [bacterium]|nr:response regulator [bacterium]
MNTTHKKVLILEDDDDAGLLVARMLESNGFKTEVVKKISSAKSKIAQEPDYDLLFFDYNLPDGNSFDLIRNLNEDYSSPIIVYSAYLTESDREEAKALGVLDCLKKPIDNQVIFATLKRHELI